MNAKEKQYIYGTFEKVENCQKALEQLKKEGLDAIVVRNKEADFQLTPVDLQMGKERFFKVAGCIGAIIGGLAGVVASPTIGVADTFQILTPVMAAIAGAVVGGYTGVIISAFLNTSSNEASVLEIFDGCIANGSTLVAVPVSTAEEKLLSIRCIDSYEPTEIIIRAGAIGPLDLQSSAKSSPMAKVA